MAYSIEIRNAVLELLLSGESAASVSRAYNNHPAASTILGWRKCWVQEGQIEGKEKVVQSPQRRQWSLKDYQDDDRNDSQKARAECKKSWNLKELLGENDNVEYNPSSLDFCASHARGKIHGDTIEDRLHLGVFQIRPKGSGQVRIKEIGAVRIKLTSQDHIYPHSHMEVAKDSNHPTNIREGNAIYNSKIGNRIDPVFNYNGKSLSNSTVSILKQYSIKPLKTLGDFDGDCRKYKQYLKQEPTFKYTDQGKIVSSNLVSGLEKNTKGSYEAPELGIMNGPMHTGSLKAYSVPLYRIDSSAGILDTSISEGHGKVIESPYIFDITEF